MDDKVKEARWRRRRIIYNNDGDDVIESTTDHDKTEKLMSHETGELSHETGELIDDFLAARTAPLVGTQVDSSWYASCMAGQTFSHHTKLGGFYGKGIPQALVDQYGRDSLQIQTDFCHENNMEAFWSLRMNDVHDAYPMGTRRWTYGLAPFKRDHPEFFLGEPEDWELYPDGPKHNWTGLDFAYPEVRDHVFATIEEVAKNYHVDGMEMDFFRHHPYFRPNREKQPVEERHLEMMTELIRRVRRLADEVGAERGRPLLVAARTPFRVDEARFIGVDVERWLAEGLLDLLIAGGGSESLMSESFAHIVDLGHRHGVPVYPCIGWGFWNHWTYLELAQDQHRTCESYIASLREKGQSFAKLLNAWPGALPAWRGAAANLFNAGADGIYTFNGFFADHQIWHEIGDPETLAGKDKLFGSEHQGGSSSFGGEKEREVNPGAPLKAQFQVGDYPSSAAVVQLQFRLHLWELTVHDQVSVRLNGQELRDLTPVPALGDAPGGHWLECTLAPKEVNQGENRVEVSLQKRAAGVKEPLMLDSIQLWVRY